MALTIANSGTNGGARVLYRSSTTHPYTNLSSQRHVLFPLSPRRTLHVVSAKRFTSRTGRLDNSNNRRRSNTTTKDQDQDPLRQRTAEIENVGADNVDDGYFLPKLPGDEPDFWEGEQWDGLGFFVEYLWAFGFAFAVCKVSSFWFGLVWFGSSNNFTLWGELICYLWYFSVINLLDSSWSLCL